MLTFYALNCSKEKQLYIFLTNFTLKNLPSWPTALTMNLNPKNHLDFPRRRSIHVMLSYTLFLMVIDICCIRKESKITCSLNKHETPRFLPMDIHILSISPMVPRQTECSTIRLLIFSYHQSCSWALLSTKQPQVHSYAHNNSFPFTFSSKQTKKLY